MIEWCPKVRNDRRDAIHIPRMFPDPHLVALLGSRERSANRLYVVLAAIDIAGNGKYKVEGEMMLLDHEWLVEFDADITLDIVQLPIGVFVSKLNSEKDLLQRQR